MNPNLNLWIGTSISLPRPMSFISLVISKLHKIQAYNFMFDYNSFLSFEFYNLLCFGQRVLVITLCYIYLHSMKKGNINILLSFEG